MKHLINIDPLFKAEDAQAYKKLAEKGIMVAHPVSIQGQAKRADIGIPYHATIKFFNPEKDSPADIHEVARKQNFIPPDPKTTRIEPGMFKDRMGNDVYVIKLHGPHAEEIKAHNKKFDHMGFPTTYEHQAHVSVDKATWDKIKNSKAQTAAEAGISFGAAQLRQGHDVLATYPHGAKEAVPSVNPAVIATKKPDKLAASEDLSKGFKQTAAAAAMLGAIGLANPQTAVPSTSVPSHNAYSKSKMLNAISMVESSGGKFANHRMLGGMHHGEHAYGKYGLTPMVIRETVNMHRDLKNKYKKVIGLKGNDLHHYMQDNPGLEDEIASRHLSRLEHHFGKNPADIGFAWLEGITGTHEAKKNKQDINGHWHVRKIRAAYEGK
jgi:hypothetical protein